MPAICGAKITGEVEAQIREELGDSKIEVAQCGPRRKAGALCLYHQHV